LKKEREREKRGGVHQTNTNYHLLEVLVPTNTKLTHVFGSKVLVLVLVCYKLTLTPPSKHDQCNHHLKKKRGRDKIMSTGNGKRFPRRSMAKLLPVNLLAPLQR
jgi:hypothetical protein